MRVVIYIGLIITLFSCASQRDVPFEYIPEGLPYGVVGDETISLDVTYVGALGTNYIFECAIEVLGGDAVSIDQDNFYLSSKKEKLLSLNVDEEINEVRKSKNKTVKNKKNRTWLSIIGGGLLTAANVAAGQPPLEALFASTETVAYAIDDNRIANRIIESQEDYIAYLREDLFNHDLLLPGDQITRDVLFPVRTFDEEVTFLAIIDGREYRIIFDSHLFGGQLDD